LRSRLPVDAGGDGPLDDGGGKGSVPAAGFFRERKPKRWTRTRAIMPAAKGRRRVVFMEPANMAWKRINMNETP
jgi:hypothetical protein